MLGWLIAVLAGVAFAAATYVGRAGHRRAPRALAAASRAVAVAVLIALLLDAPVGAARPPAPLHALDVSSSWLRGRDTTAWNAARSDFAEQSGGAGLLFGDSVRAGNVPRVPADARSAVRGAVERALAAGRPLVVHTDGELDDAQLLTRLPRGSEVRVAPRPAQIDVAPLAIDAPRAAVGGDTVDVRVRVGAGAGPTSAGALRILLDDTQLAEVPLDAMAPHGEQTAGARVVMPRREGTTLLRAIGSVPDDREPRNDTLVVPLELSAGAGVTVVSSAPDFDLRYMLEVLRGTVALPTRAFLQLTPGSWRQEGTLAPVSVETVRDAARRAPIVVLHGDTTIFGAPSAVATGALLLVPTSLDAQAEWYATAAPSSPLSAALSDLPWDSLPPLAIGAAPSGAFSALTVRLGRRGEARSAVSGREEPRRRLVVAASGTWRWRFRGGVAADAYAALWGGIFDWLAAERRDVRAALPDGDLLREGEPVRWRRGGADSVVQVVLQRRGAPAADSSVLPLTFAAGAVTTTSPPLPAGVYDVRVAGGGSVLVVNHGRELVPRPLAVASGPVGAAPAAAGVAPSLRQQTWPWVLVVALLCIEWLLRRRSGLR